MIIPIQLKKRHLSKDLVRKNCLKAHLLHICTYTSWNYASSSNSSLILDGEKTFFSLYFSFLAHGG